MAILPRPSIYEINTWLWLRELSGRYGESITLASVPAGEWDSLAEYGFDAVWLMGVWERSPLGLELALEVDALQKALTRAVPDWTPADVVGSPYCIRDYVVDPALGGPAGLAAARKELAARGMALILDFVSNHVAPDHAWVAEHPEYFVLGDNSSVSEDSRAWLPGHPIAKTMLVGKPWIWRYDFSETKRRVSQASVLHEASPPGIVRYADY